jgi:hypothetical protein
MSDPNERKEVKVFLPAYLIELFTMQGEYTGRSFNEELVNVLEKAIFLNPDDLDMIKAAAEAKAELDAIQEANSDESMALLRKLQERNRIVGEISMLPKKNPIKR